MANLQIPTNTVYSIEEGSIGAHVWALQKSLNLFLANSVVIDGAFGVDTLDGVKRFQRNNDLFEDGKFGQNSSTELANKLVSRVETGTNPKNLLKGQVEGESGNYIGAVNWSVAGGVDVGYVQRRVYAQYYNYAPVLKTSWNQIVQLRKLAKSDRYFYDKYIQRPAVGTDEWAWRLAVLYHNYPYAAEKISLVGVDGLSYYWTKEQSWVVAVGAKFDDGTSVRTPLEWCQFYSLGSSVHNHKGKMVKYVNNWTL